MKRAFTSLAVALVLSTISAVPARADVHADQKTRVQLGGVIGGIVNLFGGKAAREGVTTAVSVKGDRKATIGDSTGQIIDLTEEKIYDLDVRRKTYKVTTFAEMRRQLEEAQRRAREQAQKQQAREQKEKAPERDPNAKEMEVDFTVKDTGEKKAVNGFDTHQVLLTITVREKGKKVEDTGGIVVTSDMWIAKTVAAMKEIAQFDLRYAQKLQGPMVNGASVQEMAAALAAYPQMKDALTKMAAEGSKLEGTPILTTVTFDAVKSAEQVAQESKQGDQQKDEQKTGSSDPVGGLLGGLARRAAQRRSGGESAGQKEDKTRATVWTTTTVVLKIATDVAASDVAIPMSFKENK
jgi:hypothetical protein